jgi:hypothetical protein
MAGLGERVRVHSVEILSDDWYLLSFEDALNKIAVGEIRDGKAIMLLQYARLHVFF